jgi:hypothetical protein
VGVVAGLSSGSVVKIQNRGTSLVQRGIPTALTGGRDQPLRYLVTAALPAEAAGKPIEIWFADEAHVGQQGTITRMWAKRGSRPRALRDAVRRYPSLYMPSC